MTRHPEGSEEELAEAVVSRTLAVPGVRRLHSGSFGEVATYLPGRRIPGVRVRSDHVEVHVVMEWGRDVREVATAVRAALAEVTAARQVSVTVEDVALSDEPPEGRGHDDGGG